MACVIFTGSVAVFYMDRTTFYLALVSLWHPNQYRLISTHTVQHITHLLTRMIRRPKKDKTNYPELSCTQDRYLNPYWLIWKHWSPDISIFLKKVFLKYPCYNWFAARLFPSMTHVTYVTYASTSLQWWLNLFYPSCAELQRLVCASRELYIEQKWK